MATDRTGVQVTTRLQGKGLVPAAATITTSGSWQHATIATGAVRVVFYCTNDVYVAIDGAAAGPSGNGPPLTKGVDHVLDCYGSTKLHVKQVSAAGTFSWGYVPGDLGAS